MEHSERGPIKPVYSLKSVVLVLLRLAAFTHGQDCPLGFILHVDVCYRRVSGPDDALNWEDAKEKCSDLDAKVVEPRSSQENIVIDAMTSTGPWNVWLGGVGAGRSWYWKSDRCPLTWTNWKEGHPNKEGSCSSMTLGGVWVTTSCDADTGNVVICQVAKLGVKDNSREGCERMTNSSDKLAITSILVFVCLSTAAMMQVF